MAKGQAVRAQVAQAMALEKSIREAGRVRLEAEVKQLAGQPLQGRVEAQTELIQALKDEMSELRSELAEAEREFSENKVVMMDMLKSAKAASGVEPGTKDKPPRALRDFWEKVPFGRLLFRYKKWTITERQRPAF